MATTKIEEIKAWDAPFATDVHTNASGTKYCVSFGSSADHFWLRVYRSIPLTRTATDFIPLVDGIASGFIDLLEVASYDE